MAQPISYRTSQSSQRIPIENLHSIELTSAAPSYFDFVLPNNPSQDDWNNYIKMALEILRIIPSDKYKNCPKALALVSLNDRQINAIENFWEGLDHLSHTDQPILRYVKKILQLPATCKLNDNAHRKKTTIYFKNDHDPFVDQLKLPLGSHIGLALESFSFNQFMRSEEIELQQIDKNTFVELLQVASSDKKIDTEQALIHLPIAIQLQMKRLEQKLIKCILEELTQLFDSDRYEDTLNQFFKFEKIVSFIMKLEKSFNWEKLPDEILEHLKSLFDDYDLDEIFLVRIKEIAHELPEDPNQYTQLRNILSEKIYFLEDDIETHLEIIQKLKPSEINVDLEFDEFLKLSKIPSFKRFSISHPLKLDKEKVKDITPNPDIKELTFIIDNLEDFDIAKLDEEFSCLSMLWPNLKFLRVDLLPERTNAIELIKQNITMMLKKRFPNLDFD